MMDGIPCLFLCGVPGFFVGWFLGLVLVLRCWLFWLFVLCVCCFSGVVFVCFLVFASARVVSVVFSSRVLDDRQCFTARSARHKKNLWFSLVGTHPSFWFTHKL